MTQKSAQQGSTIARRTAARLAAVQAFYQMKASGQDAGAVIEEYKAYRLGKPVDGHNMVLPDGVLFSGIVKGLSEREDDLRHVIETNLAARKEAKSSNSGDFVEPLLWSILMCGAYELLAHHDIDSPVIISDYLEITHAFYEGGESKLVNAVLDSLSRTLRDA